MIDGEVKWRKILISTIKIALLDATVLKENKTADSTEVSGYPAAAPLRLQPEFWLQKLSVNADCWDDLKK